MLRRQMVTLPGLQGTPRHKLQRVGEFFFALQQQIQRAFRKRGLAEPDFVVHLILQELERQIQPERQRPAFAELQGLFILLHPAERHVQREHLLSFQAQGPRRQGKVL